MCKSRVLVLLLVLLLFPACADKKENKADKPVIKLAINSWQSSALNVAIAEILLEKEMGYTVETTVIDENEQWALLAQGELHACLEVWPSGHAENVARYLVDEKTVEHGGSLGVVGKIGWYIPDYMLRQRPELATWEGFKEPDNVALFASAETGGKGRFLAGDPGWVQYDADIIRNLGLDFQVVSVGTEDALLAALEAAYGKQEPILLYFWTPHWAHVLYDLVPVALPPYSEACYAARDAGGVNCDYPPDDLHKIFWSGFKNYAPDAWQFLRNFKYSNRDQIALMAAVQIDGNSTQEAARAWIEQNEAVWKSWIP